MNHLASISSVVSSIALIIAASWAYFRLRKERTHAPHIELDLVCNLHGPEKEDYLTEIIIIIDNKGLVRQDFDHMELKVRAIAEESALNYYMDKRLAAPEKLLDVQVIKKKTEDDYLFVEPGVKHLITYTTKIPVFAENSDKKIKYLFLRAKFYYDPKTPHSVERVYSVEQCLNQERLFFITEMRR